VRAPMPDAKARRTSDRSVNELQVKNQRASSSQYAFLFILLERSPTRWLQKGKPSSRGNACHGDGGAGTAAAPALRKTKFSPDQLAELFKHPTAKMNAGGMSPVDLPPDDMKALIAYLKSLK
jgi:hypothetical protein